MTGSRAAGCGSCAWRGDPAATDKVPMKVLRAREPGETVPVGLCPRCLHLAYATPPRLMESLDRGGRLRLVAALSCLWGLDKGARAGFHPDASLAALAGMVRDALREIETDQA